MDTPILNDRERLLIAQNQHLMRENKELKELNAKVLQSVPAIVRSELDREKKQFQQLLLEARKEVKRLRNG